MEQGINAGCKLQFWLLKLLQVFEVPRDIDRRVWYAFNIKEGDRIEVVNRNTDAIP